MFYFLAPLKWETSEVKDFDVFLLISLSGADWRGPGVCVGGRAWGNWALFAINPPHLHLIEFLPP